MFTGIGQAHYAQPMLDERGMAADFHFVVLLTSRLSAEALIGARFSFCQHKHAGKVEGGGGKAETLTGFKEPIMGDHL